MQQYMTIFTKQYSEDNIDEINRVTKCGNLSPLFLDPNIYFGAKATPWPNTLEVALTNPECQTDESIECIYDYNTAFDELNAGNVDGLVLSIPAFLKLKSDTEVYDNDDIVVDGSDQVTIFEEVT